MVSPGEIIREQREHVDFCSPIGETSAHGRYHASLGGETCYSCGNDLIDNRRSAAEIVHVDALAVPLLIQRKLEDGRLPSDGITGVLRGPSNGERCDACEMLITQEQKVTEAIVVSAAGHKKSIQCHIQCFRLWDAGARLRATRSSAIIGYPPQSLASR